MSSSKTPTLVTGENGVKPTLTPKARAVAATVFGDAGKPKRPASKQVSSNGKQSYYAPEGHRRLTINLPEGLHKKLKLAAIEQDCTVTDIVERLLAKEMEGQ